jgi:hypothetical protein
MVCFLIGGGGGGGITNQVEVEEAKFEAATSLISTTPFSTSLALHRTYLVKL